MTHAQLITASLLITAICVAVLVAVLRSIVREVGGLGDDGDESQAARRTEERKNERIRKELESWRDGE